LTHHHICLDQRTRIGSSHGQTRGDERRHRHLHADHLGAFIGCERRYVWNWDKRLFRFLDGLGNRLGLGVGPVLQNEPNGNGRGNGSRRKQPAPFPAAILAIELRQEGGLDCGRRLSLGGLSR
jgi:hypothetical protein